MPASSRFKLIQRGDNSAEDKALKISLSLDIHLVSRKPPAL